MAVALKTKVFVYASDLAKWAADAANGVTTVTSIVFDTGSGKYVLFYV